MDKTKSLIRVLNIVVISIAIILVIMTGTMGNYQPVSFWKSWDVVSVDSWNRVDEFGNREEVTLPSKQFVERGHTVTFETVIPDDVSDYDGYMVLSVYNSVCAFVDNTLIVDYANEPPMSFGRLTGNIRVIIPMKEIYAGKTLRIVYREYHSMKFDFTNAMFGNVGDLKLFVVYSNLWRLFITSVLLAVCFMCIGLSMAHFMKKARANNRAFFQLGLFIFYSQVWLICSSDLPQLFTDKSELISLISFISLAVLPIHYSSFCGEILKNGRKIFNTLQIIGWVVALLEIIGYATDFMDPYDPIIGNLSLLAFNHLVMLAVSVFSIQQSVKYRKTSKHIAAYAKANIVFVGMVSLAIFFYYVRQSSSLDGLFMGVGLIIFTSMLMVVIIGMEIEVLEDSRRTEIYKELAFKDLQTGLLNRGAFNEVLVHKNIELDSVVSLIILDLNYLKRINDSKGHLAGDEMIIAVADIILKAFAGHGKCYRIGGDEFAVVLLNNYEYVEKGLKKMDDYIKSFNEENKELELSVSRGSASLNYDGSSKFMDKLFTKADREMYENKEYWHSIK